MSQRAYYFNSITNFILEDDESVLGQLLINDEFETTDLQKMAWRSEIQILKEQLFEFSHGDIIFEYTIPRMGHRVDVICIIEGIIFLLEFKVGDKEYKKSTTDQVMDYALDLKYFHDKSRTRYLVPINVSTKAVEIQNEYYCMSDNIHNTLFCNEENIGSTIRESISRINDTPLSALEWINSRYVPTPTIIEAAQALYRKHGVEDISRNDAGAKNLTITTEAISNIIDRCKKNNEKAICFVTGVPGAGKTLAGLNIANERHNFNEDEHAIFLSGNGPLVDVLQNALAIDRAEREGITKKVALRETKAFIQIIHKFRDEALTTDMAPVEKQFFAKVQNKMHYAVHGHTAAELIYERADADKPHMGLTTWATAPEGKIVKSDVSVAKNYLSEQEMRSLERIVSAYLDLAEDRAERHIPMTMEDWAKRLDLFLMADDREVLQDAGKITAEIAKAKAETEFEKYRVIQDRLFMSDFDKYMLELEENAKK